MGRGTPNIHPASNTRCRGNRSLAVQWAMQLHFQLNDMQSVVVIVSVCINMTILLAASHTSAAQPAMDLEGR